MIAKAKAEKRRRARARSCSVRLLFLKGLIMIVLIMSVCLIGRPDVCRDVHLTYASDNLTPYQCVMRAPPEMARWIRGHPKWTVMRWRCGRARLDERAT